MIAGSSPVRSPRRAPEFPVSVRRWGSGSTKGFSTRLPPQLLLSGDNEDWNLTRRLVSIVTCAWIPRRPVSSPTSRRVITTFSTHYALLLCHRFRASRYHGGSESDG